jgi:prevent-host-death family protein
MKRIGARELKTRLGTYLRLVQEGLTIVVTDRGEPIAELRPLPAYAAGLEGRLRKLAATGLVTPPTRELPSRRRRVRVKGGSVSDTIVAEREDRF